MGKATRKQKPELNVQPLAHGANEVLRHLMVSDDYDTLLVGPTLQEAGEANWRFVVFAGNGAKPTEDSYSLSMTGPDPAALNALRQAVLKQTAHLEGVMHPLRVKRPALS